jgi:hypothetical protein
MLIHMWNYLLYLCIHLFKTIYIILFIFFMHMYVNISLSMIVQTNIQLHYMYLPQDVLYSQHVTTDVYI